MAGLANKYKNFLSRISFGKSVCVLLTFAFLACLCACDSPDTNPEEGVEFSPANGCLTCPVFEAVYNAGETLYKDFHSKASADAVKLLGVGFGLWLALYVLKFVGSFREPDIAGFWNGLGIRTFWVAFIGLGLLANNMKGAMEFLIEPVFKSFLELSMHVVKGLPAGSEGVISCPASNPKSGLLCLITAASKRFEQGPAIALQMLPYLFINPLLVVSGCIAIVFSYLLIIIAPLYLLESLFCYFVVLALLPMWVTAYAFPITRPFSVKAWNYFMTVFIQILGMSMFLGLSAQIFSILMKKTFPSPAAYFAGLGTDPYQAVMAPAVLIFTAYFIYLFGEVLLQVMGAVFDVEGVNKNTGGAVMRMKQSVTSIAKKVQNGVEDKAFGQSREEAINEGKKNRSPKEERDAAEKEKNSRYGQAMGRLNKMEEQNKPQETQSSSDAAGSADSSGGAEA